jgi:hypothetical protein
MNVPLGPRRFGPGQVISLSFLFLAFSLGLPAADEPPAPAAAPAPAPAANAAPAPTAATPEAVATTNVAASTAELRAAQEAIEQLRRELEHNAARNADAITAGLSVIEPALTRQLEAVRSSNQTILLVAGLFAGVAVLGLLVISLILMRAIGRFSELAVISSSRAHLLGMGQGELEMAPGRSGMAGQVSGRFHGALEQLQRRIQELEQSLQAASAEHPLVPAPSPTALAMPSNPEPEATNIQPLLSTPAPTGSAAAGSAASPSRASVLLGKGQALLNLDAADQALACFEEALTLEPGNAEALVKKGMALEKLQDWEQALECYNRAIASDNTLTVAYLYRGGVCNRLQRYREALESYEQALRTEKKVRAS